MTKYHIKSRNTGYHVDTSDETDHHDIITSNGAFDKYSVLTFSRPTDPSVPVVATITGPKGLYVSLPRDTEGTKLAWSKTKFEWIISVVPGVTPRVFQIYPRDGADLYWIDKTGIGNYVIVLAGKHVVAPQQEWLITLA